MVQMQTCAVCGKRKREKNGWFHTVEYLRELGAKYVSEQNPLWEGRVFACFRCLRPLEKANTDWAKMMRIKEAYLKEKEEKAKHDLKK
jgi:hypothetical protein